MTVTNSPRVSTSVALISEREKPMLAGLTSSRTRGSERKGFTVDRVVGRAIVDHHQLEVAVGLPEDPCASGR